MIRRTSTFCTTAVLALLLAALAPSADAQIAWNVYPDWNQETDRIAFYQRTGETSRILSMKSDGTDVVELTDGQHYDANPTWSPDGNRIAFTRAEGGIDGPWDLYVMDADGSNVEKLVESELRIMHPTWSPAGGMIAFLKADQVTTDIFTVYVSSGREMQITNTPEVELHPQWGPFSKVLSFDMTDSTRVSKVCLTNFLNKAAECPIALDGMSASTPAISPENGRIAFAMTEDGQSDIWIFDIQTGELTQVTATPDQSEAAPSWSSDREHLVFHSDPGGQNHIFVIKWDGTGRTQLTR